MIFLQNDEKGEKRAKNLIYTWFLNFFILKKHLNIVGMRYVVRSARHRAYTYIHQPRQETGVSS